jgi:peptidoglycan hydrolase-like protein with peptidoglycan-binding domain
MKTYIKAVATAVLLTCAIGAFAADQTFTRYIQKGDKGDDVVALQEVLNSDPDTIVTTTGSGSPGNESNYFGELTKQAVIKYQKKNNLGTSYGFFTIYSGALDDKTRASLNALVTSKGGIAAFQKPENGCDESVSTTNSSVLGKLVNPLTPLTNPQQALKIVEAVVNPSNALDFSVQDKWDALNAIYKMNASSTDPNTKIPFIKSVSFASPDNNNVFGAFLPSMSFQSGQQIKIVGCNFATSTPNTIHMTFSDEKATSTDNTGTVIEFTPSSSTGLQGMISKLLPGSSDASKVMQKMQQYLSFPGTSGSSTQQMPGMPMTITVENSNGVSNPYQLYFTTN